jgi:hypothetical protein
MNSLFAFSALAVLSAFPFLAVTSAAIGGDIRQGIVARMGLNAQPTRDIDGLIATGNQSIATLTWFSAIILVLGGIGMASTLSTWCHRIYERTFPRPRARRLTAGRPRPCSTVDRSGTSFHVPSAAPVALPALTESFSQRPYQRSVLVRVTPASPGPRSLRGTTEQAQASREPVARSGNGCGCGREHVGRSASAADAATCLSCWGEVCGPSDEGERPHLRLFEHGLSVTPGTESTERPDGSRRGLLLIERCAPARAIKRGYR